MTLPTLTAVSQMLPVITPYHLPTSIVDAQVLYDMASDMVLEDVSETTEDRILARCYCYVIAHILSAKDGSNRTTSQHLGEWSANYSLGKESAWLQEYHRIISSLNHDALVATPDVVQIDDTLTAARYDIHPCRSLL